jgi:hypothetical protein
MTVMRTLVELENAISIPFQVNTYPVIRNGEANITAVSGGLDVYPGHPVRMAEMQSVAQEVVADAGEERLQVADPGRFCKIS